MNRTAIRAFVLALPLVGLAAAWAWADYNSRRGTEWLVPIEGHDPRDLLRGHYVLYRYSWPGLSEGTTPESENELCIEGKAPWIERTYSAGNAPCPHYLKAGKSVQSDIHGLGTGIFYASQQEARRLDKQLRSSKLQAMMRIRVGKNGIVTPLHISFHPRAAYVYGPAAAKASDTPPAQ